MTNSSEIRRFRAILAIPAHFFRLPFLLWWTVRGTITGGRFLIPIVITPYSPPPFCYHQMLAVSNANQEPVMSTADVNRLGYIGRKPGSISSDRDADSWYTPSAYIEAARMVMGSIDLDPFSSERANETIQAARILTEDRSAFSTPWRKDRRRYPDGVCVWMNPPYSAGLIHQAVVIFLENWAAGHIAQAVVLVNNATDTQWFKALREQSTAVCFTHHRISFESPDGKRVSGNTRGQTFFYFGSESRAEAFVVEFSRFGWCISQSLGWRR